MKTVGTLCCTEKLSTAVHFSTAAPWAALQSDTCGFGRKTYGTSKNQLSWQWATRRKAPLVSLWPVIPLKKIHMEWGESSTCLMTKVLHEQLLIKSLSCFPQPVPWSWEIMHLKIVGALEAGHVEEVWWRRCGGGYQRNCRSRSKYMDLHKSIHRGSKRPLAFQDLDIGKTLMWKLSMNRTPDYSF